MSRFFSQTLASLTPYTPGEQPQDMQYIKLNTNESPYPPSPKAVAAAKEEAARLMLYPDPTCSALISALASTYGVKREQILLGNGSDELLFFAFSAFCDAATPAVFPDITYGFYRVFAELCQVPYAEIPLQEDLTVRVSDYLATRKTVFLANPNAPTGVALPLSEIRRILESDPDRVVVIDEAYVDFGGESAVRLIDEYDNLLVVQTFSKSRSMAGARLGMCFASAALIQDLNTVKYSLNPYNINRMTMAAGLGTLADAAYTADRCNRIIACRAYTEERLAALGFTFPPSLANFIFAKTDRMSGGEIYRRLKERGILVRHFDTPRLRAYNRITIGTPEQTDALAAALSAILQA